MSTRTHGWAGEQQRYTQKEGRERGGGIPPHSNKHLFPAASLQQFHTKGMKAIYTQSKYLK